MHDVMSVYDVYRSLRRFHQDETYMYTYVLHIDRVNPDRGPYATASAGYAENVIRLAY